EGLPALIYDAARNLIGGGAKAMIARGLEAEGRAYSPAKLEELFADFIAHYSDHLTEQSRPFPGVIDALDALSEHGYQFAVCTNKLEPLGKASRTPWPRQAIRRRLRARYVRNRKA
ncbi:MAG: HAD hydrolase-like protein, partial [Pseudolabrys sp.]